MSNRKTTFFYALLIALFLRVIFFQPFTIPSASMEPNLYEGDYIVVSKWSYGYSKHAIPFSPPVFEGRIFAHVAKNAAPTAVARCERIESRLIQTTSVAAGASIVLTKASAAMPFAASALPPLKPNHTNQSSPAPSRTYVTL